MNQWTTITILPVVLHYLYALTICHNVIYISGEVCSDDFESTLEVFWCVDLASGSATQLSVPDDGVMCDILMNDVEIVCKSNGVMHQFNTNTQKWNNIETKEVEEYDFDKVSIKQHNFELFRLFNGDDEDDDCHYITDIYYVHSTRYRTKVLEGLNHLTKVCKMIFPKIFHKYIARKVIIV